MDAADLSRVNTIAGELDALVPRIAEAFRAAPDATSHRRLLSLLRQAEEFFLNAGAAVAQSRADAGPTQLAARDFMHRLPARVRLLRDARVAAGGGNAIVPQAGPADGHQRLAG